MTTQVKTLTINELRVLKAVYEHGPISRVQLANGLSLTRAGITQIINKLSKYSLVAEAGKDASDAGRGRRQVMLSIDPSAGFILSLHIALHYITVAVVSLNGQILRKQRIDFDESSTPELLLTAAVEQIQKMIQGVDEGKIFGIGVAIPGIIDYQTGMVKEKSLPNWQDFPVRSFLQEHLQTQIIMENDVKALTLGEYQFGSGKHVNDMVCLWMEDGIGSGIMVDGRLLRGVTASSGEIGFNQFIMGQPVKNTLLIAGKPQFWGDVLSYTNIKNAIGLGIEDGWTSVLTAESTIDQFVTAVIVNDPLAIYIYRLLCDVIGTVTCNLIYSFNPKVMLLSGPLFPQLPHLTDDILERLSHANLRAPIDAVELKTSALGEDGISIGCAALVLEQVFKPLESNSLLF